MKQLVKFIELCLELPARRCHAEVFFGGAGREVKQIASGRKAADPAFIQYLANLQK